MNRRDTLKAMIAAGLGATIDPERLLWVPRQMIAVPSAKMPPEWARVLALVDADVQRRAHRYVLAGCVRDIYEADDLAPVINGPGMVITMIDGFEASNFMHNRAPHSRAV